MSIFNFFFFVRGWAYSLQARYNLQHHVLHHDGNKTTLKRIKLRQKVSMELPPIAISEASLLEEASPISNIQKKLYYALVNVMRGTDKQTTPHHWFLFHTHHQDTIRSHIHRTSFSPSIMPWGELNSCFLNTQLKAQHRMLPYLKTLWNFLHLCFIAKICRWRLRKQDLACRWEVFATSPNVKWPHTASSRPMGPLFALNQVLLPRSAWD